MEVFCLQNWKLIWRQFIGTYNRLILNIPSTICIFERVQSFFSIDVSRTDACYKNKASIEREGVKICEMIRYFQGINSYTLEVYLSWLFYYFHQGNPAKMFVTWIIYCMIINWVIYIRYESYIEAVKIMLLNFWCILILSTFTY